MFDRIAQLADNHLPMLAAGGLGVSSLAAGFTGNVPEGVPPAAWLIGSVVGPVILGVILRQVRAREARGIARKRAHAAELRRCAEEHESTAKAKDVEAEALLRDADTSNDARAMQLRVEARKLRVEARDERTEAAADEGEADALEKELSKR